MSDNQPELTDKEAIPVLKQTEVHYECQICWVPVPASNIDKHLAWHKG